MNTLSGMPICLVEMTGAKSGKQKTIPLMYVPHEQGVILVASMCTTTQIYRITAYFTVSPIRTVSYLPTAMSAMPRYCMAASWKTTSWLV